MSPLILGLLVSISLGAVAFLLAPVFSGGRAQKRIKAIEGDLRVGTPAGRADRDRDLRRKQVQDTLKQQTNALNAKKRNIPLQQQILQAGMTIKKEKFIRNGAIAGVIVFVICFLLEVPLLFAAVFGAAVAYLGPKLYLKRRRRKYQQKFLDELPNAVEAIVRGVKSGLPLNDSMRVVAKEVKEPVRSEFARVLEQQAVGKSIGEAVTGLFDRLPLPEVNFFVVVITVQQQAGGNLSEALTNLARVLRNRKKMKAKVKAMSSEAKASAMIIGSLPFIVGTLVSLVSPAYMVPLFTSQIGYLWLGIAAVLMSFGIFVMYRMVQFDY